MCVTNMAMAASPPAAPPPQRARIFFEDVQAEAGEKACGGAEANIGLGADKHLQVNGRDQRQSQGTAEDHGHVATCQFFLGESEGIHPGLAKQWPIPESTNQET
mgnify:CR=1 FL=1